jgi:hypothetical protein
MDVRTKRRCRLLGMICLASMGCNPLLAPFLLGRADSKTPAEYALKQPAEKQKAKEDARVVVLVSMRPTGSEVPGADRALASDFVKVLEDHVKVNKEKLTIVPAREVEKFTSDNTGWPLRSRVEIGRQFKADYVIELEISDLKLYEPRSDRSLYKGRAAITVTAYDVSKGTEEPAYRSEINQEYPRSGGYIEAGDITPRKFQTEFIRKLAVELAWKFTEHDTKRSFGTD